VDNTLATTDPTDPGFSCHFSGAGTQGVGTVWYTFTAAATSAFLETNNSAVADTLLAVYDGSCGSLVEIACSEDEGDGLLSEVCVEGLSLGTTYFVQVASFSAGSQGSITLDIACPCPGLGVANDECVKAEEVPCNGSVALDNTLATTNPTDPGFSCHFSGAGTQGVGTVWYTFTAAGTTAFLETNNSAVSDTLLAVYDGSCGSLVEIACSEDEGDGLLSEVCVEGLSPGTTYYVQVASFSAGSQGFITLDITCPCPGLGVANDECVDAEEVPCNGSVTVDNTNATTDPTDPGFSCHFNGPGTQGVGTVWYTFTAEATSAFLETNNSAVSDTLLAVYAGSCGFLVEIACSEDEGDGLLSEVCVEGLAIGATYFVQVASFSAGSLGSITLDITCPPCDADLSGSGGVGFLDLTTLLEDWGPCCPDPTLFEINSFTSSTDGASVEDFTIASYAFGSTDYIDALDDGKPGGFNITVTSGPSDRVGWDFDLVLDYSSYDVGFFLNGTGPGVHRISLFGIEDGGAITDVTIKTSDGSSIGKITTDGNSIFWSATVEEVFAVIGGSRDLPITIQWASCDVCPADLNGDWSVGFADLQALLQAWGVCPTCAR